MARRVVSFKDKPSVQKKLILKCVKEKTADRAMLNTVMADILEHLRQPAGTLENYAGFFGVQIIPALRENYPEELEQYDAESIVQQKLNAMANHVLQRMYAGEKPNITPQLFALIRDYIRGRDTDVQQIGPQYVVVGYREDPSGNVIAPEPKTADIVAEQ